MNLGLSRTRTHNGGTLPGANIVSDGTRVDQDLRGRISFHLKDERFGCYFKGGDGRENSKGNRETLYLVSYKTGTLSNPRETKETGET